MLFYGYPKRRGVYYSNKIGIREDIVHYTTQYLSPEDAEALGGAMGKLFVGNTLVAFFTDIEGKFLDKQTGNTLHFQLKTNPL